jgi:hypothetical protein
MPAGFAAILVRLSESVHVHRVSQPVRHAVRFLLFGPSLMCTERKAVPAHPRSALARSGTY